MAKPFVIHTEKEIEKIRKAAQATAYVRDELARRTCAGMSTLEVDELAAALIAETGGRSAFLGYGGFPGHVCISVNEEVVHGIGRSDRILTPDDIVSIDVGVAIDGDSCYNGADDNASGVSAVLQIARAVKTMQTTPRRGIIFAFWDGEEKGMLGSRHFVKNCSFLSDISAYMNFDMIGRGPVDNPKHLTYFYTASHPMFGDWLKEDMDRHGFSFIPDYRAWEKPTGGSDNASFAKKGIPIVWYHTEGHPDYHRPSDTADKIDYEKMLDITRAAFLCAWRLANYEY